MAQAGRRSIAFAAALALLVAATEPSVAHAPAGKVRVATTGDHSEMRKTIPITPHLRRAERVVMSMSPHNRPSVAPDDRLEVNAELQVTTDCIRHEGGCAGKPYQFDPEVGYRIVLASNEHATSGADATPITDRREVRCRQRLPNRQHHCVLVFRRGGIDFDQADQLPCALGSCYVNFVVDAHNRRARTGDRLIVGGIDPHGRVRDGKGRLNAVRLRPGDQPRVPAQSTHNRRAHRLHLPARHREVVFSERLPHLEAGEQLVAKAKMKTDISRLDYNTRVSSTLILAEHRHSIHRTRLTRRIGGQNGTITEINGFNCTQVQSPCSTRKVGVERIRHDAVDGAGDPVPLFVNLVTVAKAKHAEPGSGDHVHVLPTGGLHVTRYPASMRG
jgi:hypothetical protein